MNFEDLPDDVLSIIFSNFEEKDTYDMENAYSLACTCKFLFQYFNDELPFIPAIFNDKIASGGRYDDYLSFYLEKFVPFRRFLNLPEVHSKNRFQELYLILCQNCCYPQQIPKILKKLYSDTNFVEFMNEYDHVLDAYRIFYVYQNYKENRYIDVNSFNFTEFHFPTRVFIYLAKIDFNFRKVFNENIKLSSRTISSFPRFEEINSYIQSSLFPKLRMKYNYVFRVRQHYELTNFELSQKETFYCLGFDLSTVKFAIFDEIFSFDELLRHVKDRSIVTLFWKYGQKTLKSRPRKK